MSATAQLLQHGIIAPPTDRIEAHERITTKAAAGDRLSKPDPTGKGKGRMTDNGDSENNADEEELGLPKTSARDELRTKRRVDSGQSLERT